MVGPSNKIKFVFTKHMTVLNKMNAVGYKRLYLMRVINQEQPTNNLLYVLEDDIHHENLWKHRISIRDNSGITIGTILCFFFHRNLMKTSCQMVFLRLKVDSLLQSWKHHHCCLSFLLIWESMVLCLNNCTIESLAITPEETGCAGRFCDNHRIVEVM